MSQRGTRQTAYRSSIEMITLDKKEHLAELGNTRSLTYKDVDWTSRSICQQYQMLIPLVNRIVAEHRQGEARLTKAPTSVFKNWNKSRKQFTSRLHTLLQILDLPHRHLQPRQDIEGKFHVEVSQQKETETISFSVELAENPVCGHIEISRPSSSLMKGKTVKQQQRLKKKQPTTFDSHATTLKRCEACNKHVPRRTWSKHTKTQNHLTACKLKSRAAANEIQCKYT